MRGWVGGECVSVGVCGERPSFFIPIVGAVMKSPGCGERVSGGG